MEIKKITDTQIEVTDAVIKHYFKNELEEEQICLEKRLTEVNNLLLEFDK